jgi:hypothetical protein
LKDMEAIASIIILGSVLIFSVLAGRVRRS